MGPKTVAQILTFLYLCTFRTALGQIKTRERNRNPPGRGVQQRALKPSHRGDIDISQIPTETMTEQGESDVHPLSHLAYWYGVPGQRGYIPQRPHPCEQSSCYPATGNLLIGREKQLKASSTCGLYKQERFCIVSHLEERKKCFWCDSRDEHANNPARSHRIENIVYKNFPGTEQRSWWQSENGVENVTIQLDLEAEFHFTHMIITFKTFRPAAMLIERSYDFGRTWQVYRYFAYNCNESFPNIPKHKPRTLTDVVCESRYSNVAPSTGGEVIFRVLLPNLPIDDPYSPEVQNLLKMTNLRINFTKLHTLGDDLLDNREEIQIKLQHIDFDPMLDHHQYRTEKYYYAINQMVVRGSCSCYGHASRCLPLPGVESKPNMVHGRCECTHNTKGLNCEFCEDFYNDLPWKPAFGKQTNACKRCNCNNHATSCHFDAAVYDISGRVSGGVCDNCQHNTQGRNCEQCRDFYYHDPERDITDPEACQPCDCDPSGSLDEGICDSRTDIANGLESGRCHCKANVDGRRCDRCKNGYWNFDEENPDGCQPCTCNTQGTVDNQGCNVLTGECTCKRYVTGRDCNQCLLNYWGLSDDRDGCKPCDCDPGGSYDNNCDVITGQCRCRPHVTGQQCNQPEQSYFTATLDFLVYEAELARGSETCQVVIREPNRDGRENSWTGTGFMRAFTGSELEFPINNIQQGMDYDIVVRYEPQVPGTWEVQVDVIRPGPVDRSGPCANAIPDDDTKVVFLSPDSRSVPVYPPVCLEPGKDYKVRLTFKRYDGETDVPSASILVDSIALIPRPESIPFFQGANNLHRQEFERYQCGQAFYSVLKGDIPDVCQKYHHSIGFYVHGGAFPCQCDPTGSVSAICSELGGACTCKPNVVGRRCDRCAPGTYGFGPEGCRACDCNSIGALDNFCDVQTGQCKCRANTYGRECDQCQPGFWNFPNCQQCTCNGHADVCDPQTGACTECRDFTLGHNCDRCVEGYYGDPRIGVDIPCRPCPCPGTVDSGHSYATRCGLDTLTQDVVCECDVGYAGSRCDVCADNYFGNPDTPGGSCRPCNCSKNIDLARPGNCDARSGECLQCLFHTEGFHCEICKANYYGDAINQQCAECVCDILGTNNTAGPCDRNTGQCPCLPNVIGQKCDECKPNHWKIASGTGCEPCGCDPVGSTAEQCNLFDGQCNCKPGFGGRQCNECQANHWGNPTVKCHACECDPDGSLTMQCHRENGTCICLEGIGGEKCNQCARGYLGSAPQCSPCGECFTNWDRILNELRDETNQIIQDASKIKQTGATGAYSREFDQMEKKLKEIEQMLSDTSISSQDLESLNKLVEDLRGTLNHSSHGLDDVEKILQNATQRILLAHEALRDLQVKKDKLNATALGLKENATRLQEANVEGALNLTREAWERSEKAQQIADESQSAIADSERQCKRAETLVNRTSNQFIRLQDENTEALADLETKLIELEEQIPDINNQVCGKRGDPCDKLCGGAGCDSCGGLSCEQGAVTMAERALKFADDARKAVENKEAEADDLLRGVSQARQETINANTLAQEAYDKALEARNRSDDIVNRTQTFIDEVNKFFGEDGASPSDIRTLAKEVLSKNINLEPESITYLAQNINNTIASLTNIEVILMETNDSLTKAKSLEEQADAAKEGAEGILDTAKLVADALDEAQNAQDKAEEAIKKANSDILVAERDLTQIASGTEDAQQKANETVVEVNLLQARLKPLQTQFLQNAHDAEEVAQEAEKLEVEVQRAQNDTSQLQELFREAGAKLNKKAGQTDLANNRAQSLLKKSSTLLSDALRKRKELDDMKKEYDGHEKVLKDLNTEIEDLIRRMDQYQTVINEKADYYRACLS